MPDNDTIPFYYAGPYCKKHGCHYSSDVGCGACETEYYWEECALSQDVPYYSSVELAPKVVDPHAYNPEDPDDIAF